MHLIFYNITSACCLEMFKYYFNFKTNITHKSKPQKRDGSTDVLTVALLFSKRILCIPIVIVRYIFYFHKLHRKNRKLVEIEMSKLAVRSILCLCSCCLLSVWQKKQDTIPACLWDAVRELECVETTEVNKCASFHAATNEHCEFKLMILGAATLAWCGRRATLWLIKRRKRHFTCWVAQ